jgi:RNA polymerase sigma-70 factor (ECF subfamily)
MQSPEDRDIIRKIKRGEIANFEYVVKKYTKQILAFVSRKLYDKSEVEDIVQSAFIKFYKAINRFDETKPILPYLFEITKNEIKMYFRSRKQTVSLDEQFHVKTSEISLFEQDAETLLELLSNQQKEALTLLTEGYSYEEIAKKLGKPLNTVKTIIRRGRLKLAKILKK